MLLATTIGEFKVSPRWSWGVFMLLSALLPAACGGDDKAGEGGGSGGGVIFNQGDGGGPGATVPSPPPDSQFTKADVGSYAVGQEVQGVPTGIASAGQMGQGCDVMVGVVRDFKGANEPGGHGDFETFNGDDPTKGLVADALGADQKPVYASQCGSPPSPDKNICPFGQQTTTQAAYDQWYRYTENVNKPYLVYFKFAANGNVYTFQSTAFFPLDGKGWGNTPKANHNFHFTTELHTQFQYNGGERFTFTGDDDLWVFINGKLAMDLGGLHPQRSDTLDLDASAGKLGITKGQQYPLALFHAERHTNASNFRVDTTLAFTNCGTIVPDIH
jgi:fibro-slime domain-containing protein